MRTVILGAGISGLTAAHALSKVPEEYPEIYEKASNPGGLCFVQERDGFRFDVVSHVLHFRSDRARRLVHDLLGERLRTIERSAWIYFKGRYIPYPFQGHLGFLPWPERMSCLGSYLRSWTHRRLNGNHLPDNFEDWINYHFGSGIARHFMVPYNTDLWGVSPREMSIDWVRPFVPKSSLMETVRGLFTNGSARAGYNSSFSYPDRNGMQALVDSLANSVPEIQFNREAAEIHLDRKTVTFSDGESNSYDRLISTIPLDGLVNSSRGVPESMRKAGASLRSSRLLNLVFCLRKPLPHSYHWVYFSEAHFPFFRLVFPSNISPSLAPKGCSIVCAEVSNPDLDALTELEQSIRESLLALKMIAKPSDIAFTVKNYLTHAYPIHDLKRETTVKSLLDFLKTKDVYSIGRFGGWRYSSIDDAMDESLDVVDQLAMSPLTVETR